MAIQWYDKVIKEFSGSDGAELAYQRKLFILIDETESLQSSFQTSMRSSESNKKLSELMVTADAKSLRLKEAKESANEAQKYSDLANEKVLEVLKTFTEFETTFPNSTYTQALRYQIAQMYWKGDDDLKTKEWLQKIIDVGKGEQTFYTETAKARLENIKKQPTND